MVNLRFFKPKLITHQQRIVVLSDSMGQTSYVGWIGNPPYVDGDTDEIRVFGNGTVDITS
jgi:hypothetical protein